MSHKNRLTARRGDQGLRPKSSIEDFHTRVRDDHVRLQNSLELAGKSVLPDSQIW